MNMSAVVQSLWGTLLLNAVAAWPVLALLRSLKSRQTIDPYAPKEHQEKQGTPTMGGLMILPGLLLAAALLPANAQDVYGSFANANWTLLGLILGFASIGFVDDFVVPKLMKGKRGLGWKQKLLMQIALSAGCLALSPQLLKHPILFAVGVFLILFFSNAYNFADGLDGLAGSLLVTYALGLLALSFAVPGILSGMLPFLFALAAAPIPFLFLNAPPAKVFMGDVGSLPIGAVLGYLNLYMLDTALQTPNAFWPIFGSATILALVLILELVLVPIQVAYYKKTKKRIFPATPIHHAFEVKGIPERKVVWWFFLAQIVLVLIAWTLLSSSLKAISPAMGSLSVGPWRGQ